MMFYAVIIAGLTVVYNLALASFAWEDMVVGAMLSTVLVAVFRRAIFPLVPADAGFVAHIIVYLPLFLWMLVVDIVKGTWQVAMYVVGIRKLEKPGILKIPLGNHTPAGVGVVGLFVTVSPGSFLVDIDWDERVMLVHYIDASDPVKLIADVEKYYNLWEYGRHVPRDPNTDARPEEMA